MEFIFDEHQKCSDSHHTFDFIFDVGQRRSQSYQHVWQHRWQAFKEFPTPETIRVMCTNFWCNDLWDRLGGQGLLMIGGRYSELFNKSLRLGCLPKDWKLANIVPVFKKDNKEQAENYRSISLLSIVSKVMERCLFNAIGDHVLNLISTCQHGFIAEQSCVTQLVEVLDQTGTKLDRGGQVDIIYLDMSKTFDTVNHAKLLRKLHQYGFGGNLLTWLESYLHNRSQWVTILGATSSPLPVTSGVPQGSILGPVLFLLYLNSARCC